MDMPEPNASIELDSNKLPKHIGIIMDGNRRWAVKHDLNYIEGHKEAVNRVREIVLFCADNGIEYVTLWAWSTKNWKRGRDFILGIIWLFREQLKPDGIFQESYEKGVKLHHIGHLKGFPGDIKNKLEEFILREPQEKRIDVNLALGYEGRDEIMRAFKKMTKDRVPERAINTETISTYMDTAGQPDPDLIIRTGGDRRTSGFMIWQAADAELYFTDDYMPDFTVDKLKVALADYTHRERRMGGDSKKY